ncbi:hypothetical protein E4U09_005769 [Claviceps aff. purpurea]|uniref:C2H2-type domain-containing protein n=1 Tax=Claviceps aff. purpurea TaxID=1967640 RepID=A0A9P7QPR1_9HYPO|nr:hypothetical protein E4U37_002069 [Claviceps purpurea]KAG6163695.1 hypothetical protein E4U11_001718 [Claviceps purpurea]KAG6216613.1 hypothetical protein E4U50_005412 [Claviceps purpurea]KAG6303730.1 hypothetical protein E4U09_005769 [Claviceps aff. purpurea]
MAKNAMAYHLSFKNCQERLAERLEKPRGPQKLVRCLRCLRNFRQSAADEHLETHAKAINARN